MRRRDFLTSIPAAGAALLLPEAIRPALAAATQLKFRDLYVTGDQLSQQTLALEGQRIRMTGYMAPPLKPEVNFFVLTKLPMSVCPFCENEAQWPDDIVVAYADASIEVVRYTDLITVEGKLETGFWTDPETQFVSLIRITGASYEKR